MKLSKFVRENFQDENMQKSTCGSQRTERFWQYRMTYDLLPSEIVCFCLFNYYYSPFERKKQPMRNEWDLISLYRYLVDEWSLSIPLVHIYRLRGIWSQLFFCTMIICLFKQYYSAIWSVSVIEHLEYYFPTA